MTSRRNKLTLVDKGTAANDNHRWLLPIVVSKPKSEALFPRITSSHSMLVGNIIRGMVDKLAALLQVTW